MSETTLTGSAIREVEALAARQGSVIETPEGVFVRHNGAVVDPRALLWQPPLPMTVEFSTLTGLRDFLAWEKPDNTCLRVISPRCVALMGELVDDRRVCLASATFAPNRDWLGKELAQTQAEPTAVVVLMTECEATVERDELVRLISNLEHREELSVSDDGVSVRATVRKGPAQNALVTVKPTWTLRVRQTFPEVEQPERTLLLRVKKAGEGFGVALYEADGRAWEAVAKLRIAAKLRELLSAAALDYAVLA